MAVLTYNARDFLQLAQEYSNTGKSHAGIIISSEQYTRRQFGQLLRLVLHLINSLTADEMRDRILYLQQFR